jgi:hypothetical protein
MNESDLQSRMTTRRHIIDGGAVRCLTKYFDYCITCDYYQGVSIGWKMSTSVRQYDEKQNKD